MGYPSLSRENADKVIQKLLDAREAGLDPMDVQIVEAEFVTVRSGDEYRAALVEGCGSQFRKRWEKPDHDGLNEYQLEGLMAVALHSTLSHLGMDMLEDEDFWRYLAAFPLRWFLLAREPELQPQDYGGTKLTIVEGEELPRKSKTLMANQLIFRTFIWGKIAVDELTGDYSRATVIDEHNGPSIDIWHSHMIRTQLGQLGRFPHAFIDVIVSDIDDGEKMKEPARKVEKLLARVKHGVLFDVYGYQDAETLTREQLARVVD